MDCKKEEWEQSYRSKDNYIFYPHEEVIRFISKYIRKQIGFKEFIDKREYLEEPRVLDFGCGIGRHVLLLNDFSVTPYGFDLSETAIKEAHKNLERRKLGHLCENVITSDIRELPYSNEFFDFMLSHGVLDSMPFEIAREGILELYSKLKKHGLIYLDLIDVESSSFNKSKGYNQIVTGEHEKNTIQSFYNLDRIEELIKSNFEILEIYKIQKKSKQNTYLDSRFHLILKKI